MNLSTEFYKRLNDNGFNIFNILIVSVKIRSFPYALEIRQEAGFFSYLERGAIS